jgi:SNF2 family DNA or RNA helicase
MVEAQAAARVDRLDQMKDVYIYRYIVKDSIEEVGPRTDSLFKERKELI